MPAPRRVAEVERIGRDLARRGELSSRSLSASAGIEARAAQVWLARWRADGLGGKRLEEVRREIVSPTGRGCPLAVYGLAQ